MINTSRYGRAAPPGVKLHFDPGRLLEEFQREIDGVGLTKSSEQGFAGQGTSLLL